MCPDPTGPRRGTARARLWPGANAHSTTVDRGGRHVRPLFRPAGGRGPREAIIRRARRSGRWRRCVTPRQTCPRPSGFGRNLRSKTRWFTGFCNSHQVSHFATFFIDARAEISVAESRSGCDSHRTPRRVVGAVPGPPAGAPRSVSFPWRLGRRGSFAGGGLRRAVALPRWGFVPTGSRVALFRVAPTMILPQVHLRKPCYDFSFL